MEEASFLNEIIREGLDNQIQIEVEQEQESSSTAVGTTSAPLKRKRSEPENPYLDAEVIALSPNSLQATNRFICEVCNKGFQREQNLQLHRRGHNLPWKLKQKSNIDVVRKKIYLCPEPTCVHHHPSRALGDLTGIKKHYSRKHGEKKFRCEKCSKRYAVQSDWKAHLKTCGTREYRCDCGTVFSRRDSFVTHRAFCDAIAEESARMPIGLNNSSSFGLLANHKMSNTLSLSLPPLNSQFCSFQDQAQSSWQMTPTLIGPSYSFYLPSAVPNAHQQFQESMIKPFSFLVQPPSLHTGINAAQNDAGYTLSYNQTHSNNNSIYSGNLMGNACQYGTQIGASATGGYDRSNSESMNMGSMSYGMESNSKLKDLMYSFANGSMRICGAGYDTSGLTVNDQTYGSGIMGQGRLLVGGNEMTRDFLGVRTGRHISAVEPELRSESSSTTPLISGGGCLMQSYGSN